MRLNRVFAVIGTVIASSAFAQVTPIGPFAGAETEGFERGFQSPVFFPSIQIFPSNAATLESFSSSGHITTGWGFSFTIFPYAGSFFFGDAGSGCRTVFNAPVSKFGGYFGTNANQANGTATFFDEAGNVVGTATIDAPQGSWAWNGWEFTTPVKTIQVIGTAFGGFIMHDELTYTAGGGGCTVDLNGDGAVDFNDYLEFLNLFNANDLRVDYNRDGAIDFNDYLEFLNLFNVGC